MIRIASLVLTCVLLLPPAAAADPAPENPLDRILPARPGRLVVKYRARVDACAHCLLAHGTSFATATGTDSLDRLHRQLRVRGARSLFFDDHGSGRSAAYAAKLAAARSRFPQRSARIAAGANAPDLSNVFVLDLPRGADLAGAAAQYAADPDVEYAHPDYEVQANLVPNDPFFSSSGSWGQGYEDLWGLHITDATTAWDTANGSGAIVAVIDTGVDHVHPDLAANMWINPGETPGNGIDDDANGFVDDVRGWDFDENDNTPYDRHGHGTHVAVVS